jgi:hypothetical protein
MDNELIKLNETIDRLKALCSRAADALEDDENDLQWIRESHPQHSGWRNLIAELRKAAE